MSNAERVIKGLIGGGIFALVGLALLLVAPLFEPDTTDVGITHVAMLSGGLIFCGIGILVAAMIMLSREQ